MSQTIKIKSSDVPGKMPAETDLSLGELAVNTNDGKLYMKKTDGSIVSLSLPVDDGGSGGPTAGASAGSVIAVQIGDGQGRFDYIPPSLPGRVLTSNGTQAPTWEPAQVSGGTVTRVTLSGALTGLHFTGGDPPLGDTITTSGTLTLGGKLSLLNGGTGASSASEAIANLLPDQTGNLGAALVTDGQGQLSWYVVPGTAYSAGNDGIEFAGSQIFSRVVQPSPAGRLQVSADTGDGSLLAPIGPGTPGQVLTSVGDNFPPVWGDVSGTVSSVKIQLPVEGLFIAGGDPTGDPSIREITTTGTISINGVAGISQGGTGAATEEGLQAVIKQYAFPPQDGEDGKFLMTYSTLEGNQLKWETPPTIGTVTSVSMTGGSTGLEFTGGPITDSGTFVAGGVLNVLNGGTGASSPNAAIRNLLPEQTSGTVGQVLTSNGTDPLSWSPVGLGTVTSVDVQFADGMGFTSNGGPITQSGDILVTGTLSVEFGGTGGNDKPTALANLLPTQSALTENKVLMSNGATGDTKWGLPTLDEIAQGTGETFVDSVDVSGGDTGLTFTGGPVTNSGVITMAGVLSVAHGGTGGADPDSGLNNLLPDQAAAAGKFLTSNGTTVSWMTPAGGGTVTSVDIAPGTSGLEFTGGPITQNGSIVVGGTLALLHGGTGGVSAQEARNNILPEQTSFANQFLMTNGSDVQWAQIPNAGGTVTSVNIDGGTSGLLFGGGPITSSGTFTVSGALEIANGGTGASTAVAAINNLVPSQAGQSSKFLTTNGTAVSWASLPASTNGTVTSINVAGGTTGLTFSGGPVTTSGVITAGGTLAVTNGGTGAVTAQGAIDNLLPQQTGNAGKFLTTNGTTSSWTTATASAAGADAQIQYNNSGVLGASSLLTINKLTGALTSASTLTGTASIVNGAAATTRPITFATSGVSRWVMQADSTAESGSNAGSNFSLASFNDAGTQLGQVFSIARASRVLDFKVNPTINGVQVGYLNVPRTTTFDASAKGTRVAVSAGFTIPANTYVAGDAFSFYNDSGAAITVTQGSGLTLRQDGTANTGNRTLAQRGSCFVWFNSATEAIISGSIT